MGTIMLPKDCPGQMFDDFFIRALFAGIGVALVAGPFGCFIIWRKLAYFGDTLSHAALLGVALAFLVDSNVTITVFFISSVIAIILIVLRGHTYLPADSLLGLISHSALALGVVVLALMSWVRIDLMGLLFGDILAVSRFDLVVIYTGGCLVLGLLSAIWQSLFAATVNRELAEAEGLEPKRDDIIFMVLIAGVIAMAINIVGVLLITALLIIPAATARQLSSGPEQMAILAALIGVISVCVGLAGSLEWDIPSGPSIVVAAMVFFFISISPLARFLMHHRSKLFLGRG